MLSCSELVGISLSYGNFIVFTSWTTTIRKKQNVQILSNLALPGDVGILGELRGDQHLNKARCSCPEGLPGVGSTSLSCSKLLDLSLKLHRILLQQVSTSLETNALRPQSSTVAQSEVISGRLSSQFT
ncbi:hypothetical protein RRG08_032360 [Elysia crispata]|uniref:Uncharacterized protein n=1 Tax=Elysia crispata TaxID=231223 RepID=A0AAE1AGI3_9GAST|nr:hypothetical protein RRG08_032360 [Elysia crispata]